MLKKINKTWEMYNTLIDVKFKFLILDWKNTILLQSLLLDMMYYMKI